MRAFGLMISITIMLGLMAVSASAQDAAEINRIIRGLAPIAGQTGAGEAPDPLTATAPRLEDAGSSPSIFVEVVLPDRVIVVDATVALDFEVYFPFDSADLTLEARNELLALGAALASRELQPYRYLIAGHTDAKGDAVYNLALSERRAAAVRRFLVEQFPIAPARLFSIGFGETRLKVPDAPQAALNRRVEVMLVASE